MNALDCNSTNVNWCSMKEICEGKYEATRLEIIYKIYKSLFIFSWKEIHFIVQVQATFDYSCWNFFLKKIKSLNNWICFIPKINKPWCKIWLEMNPLARLKCPFWNIHYVLEIFFWEILRKVSLVVFVFLMKMNLSVWIT